MKLARTVAVGVGISMAAGLGAGFAVEGHTNEMAEGRILTIEGCNETVPHETKINWDLIQCYEEGVPGGQPVDIGKARLEEGQPMDFTEIYITAQRTDAASIEVGRLAIWSVVPITVAGASLWTASW